MAKASTNRGEFAERKKLQDEVERQQRADLAAVMGTPEGRRLVWRFLEQAGPFRSAFNTNAMAQSHCIGWQDAGKWWLQEIERACPERFTQMAAEARKAARDAAFRADDDEANNGTE